MRSTFRSLISYLTVIGNFFGVAGYVILVALVLGGTALVWAWQNEELQPLVAAIAGGAAVVLATAAGFTANIFARAILVAAAGAFAAWFSWYTVKDLTDQVKEKTQLAERTQRRLQLALDDIVDFVKPLPKDEYRKIVTIAGFDNLRNRFKDAIKRQPPFNSTHFESSHDVIYVLQKLEGSKNGHALAVSGEILRALKHPDSESQFYAYLEHEKLSTRNGLTGSEECRTPEGYCRERTAWIFHQLARDILEQGRRLKAAGKPEAEYRQKLAEALKHACSAIKLYPHDGFSQLPTTRTVERSLHEELGRTIPEKAPEAGACL